MCDDGAAHSRSVTAVPHDATMWSFSDADDLAADIERLFDALDRAAGRDAHQAGPVHTPPLDVYETPSAIDVVADLPGVKPDALRLVFKHGVLLLAGEKAPPDDGCRDGSSFHLVERSFGRFARVVRFDTAIDAVRARATLNAGVLRVTVPRIPERRGRDIVVTVETPSA
jgi:HSP20 family protein